MGGSEYFKMILALAFVLALMGIAAQLIKRSSFGKLAMGARGKRLSVVETRPIDARHKLVLVKCDEREYLLLLSHDRASVIDPNVKTSV